MFSEQSTAYYKCCATSLSTNRFDCYRNRHSPM